MPAPKDPIKYAEYCRKISESNKRRSPESYQKPTLKGVPRSDETKRKISEGQIGKKRPGYIDTLSPETRLKLSLATKGKKRTEENCRNISEGLSGRTFTDEHRQNIRLSKLGKPSNRKGVKLSDETKKKLGDSAWTQKPELKEKRDAMYKKRSENPEWVKNHDDASQRISQDPDWKMNHKTAMRKRAKDYNWRLKNVESHIGGFWIGEVRYYDGPQYCEKFNADFKKRCRAYWNYTCMLCGVHESQHITKTKGRLRALTVHHVHYDKDMCCNGSPRDVVTLCGSCNVKVNNNRKHWERYFTDLIYSQSASGKCYFEPEEMDEE